MAAVSALGEVGLIAALRRRLGASGTLPGRAGGWRLVAGIGDDAAVLRGPDGRLLLLACDMLIEGVHFLRGRERPEAVGWKALAVNLSDIAAMGGAPLAAVVSLGLPRATSAAFAQRLYRGLARCARRFGVAVVGGDTTRAPKIIVDVAILGTVTRRRLTLRRGARVGDSLFVTGRLGGSLRSGSHAAFTPRLAEAAALTRRVRVHAMMDLSDGLASDLWQLSRASRAALRVRRAAVPRAAAARSVDDALQDGEDFELLFAAAQGARVPRRLGRTPVTRIGRVVGRGVRVEQEYPDGRISPLIPTGFRHF
jgi:thiamine-monophosphate kinase